jgi:glycyl-tRNA synthetase
VASLDKKKLGPMFRRGAKAIETAVAALDQSSLESLSLQLEQDSEIALPIPELPEGKAQISKELLKIERVSVVENVIEPSFGIGRILYSLLEQVYWHRPQDVARV